jgi:hypothetical protein
MGWGRAITAAQKYDLPPGALFKIISAYRKEDSIEGLLRYGGEYDAKDVSYHNLLIRLDIEFETDGMSPGHHDNRCPIHKED